MSDHTESSSSTDERRIFVAALDRPEESRAAYVAEACGADAALRERVLHLLRALDLAGTYLSLPEPAGETRDPLIGQSLGPYRIAGVLGEGGFGRVYRAEQEAPLRRTVALKILKAGLESEQVVARFGAERQALAVMDHPNIARVFDGGVTREGRPYFVMELVNGEPITAYCDRHRLDATARLRLAITVCEAVHHAHQKGVIHRGIKPSNILVMRDGERDIAKVIDFGIAKAIDGDLTERAVVTELRQLIGTPAYMSPEQADRDRRKIDTRTDVYSLGVVLYELLTGGLPIDQDSLLAAGLEEMRRVLRESDPQRPSARLTSVGGGANEIARARSTDVRRLQRFVRGDLDWIVMKAIDRDPERRYGSSAELAADIGRLLRHEPVEAGPPTATYRIGKFLRRHRTGVVAGSLVVASLLIGAGAAVLGFVQARADRDAALIARDRERQAREVAEREGEQARVQSDFISWGLGIGGELPIDESERQGITVRRMLDVAAQTIEREYADAPFRRAVAHSRLGSLYNRVLRTEEATRELLRAIGLLRGIDSQPSKILLYESLRDLDSVGVDQNLTDKALDALRRERAAVALSILADRIAVEHPESFARLKEAIERMLAATPIDSDEADRIEEAISTLLREPFWGCDQNLAIFLDLFATSVRSASFRRDSVAIVRLARNVWSRFADVCPNLGADHIRAAIDELLLAQYCVAWGRGADAIPLFEHGRAMIVRHLPRDHPVVLAGEFFDGRAHVMTGKADVGVGLMRSAIERLARVEGVPPGWLGRAVADLLTTCRNAGVAPGLDELKTPLKPFATELQMLTTATNAKQANDASRAMYEAIAPIVGSDPELATMILSAVMPRLELQTDAFGVDLADVRRLLELLIEAVPAGEENTWADSARAVALWWLGLVALDAGEFATAESHFVAAEAIRERIFGTASMWVQNCRRGRAKVLIARGEMDAGLAMLRQAHLAMTKAAFPSQAALWATTRDLARALANAGQPTEAGRILAEQLTDGLDFVSKEKMGIGSIESGYRLMLAFPIVLLPGLPEHCYATAERCSREAFAFAPQFAWGYGVAGAALVRQGRFAEGEALLRQAQQLLDEAKTPPVTTFTLFLARCADARGDKAEADRLRTAAEERASKIKPDLSQMTTWPKFRDSIVAEFAAP